MSTTTTPQTSAADKKAAHIFLTELRTRIATQDLPYQHGVEKTALKSLVDLFDLARKVISDNQGCQLFAEEAIAVLNDHLRPVTAKWHPLSVSGVLDSRDGGDAFRADLQQVQKHLQGLADRLHQVAYGTSLSFPAATGPMSATLNAVMAPLVGGIPEDALTSGGIQAAHARAINQAEWLDIASRRAKQHLADMAAAPIQAPKDLVGLAFSGGGIRSATFCLGVQQVLVEKGLMPDVDYLSTVSGGGYTGSFITRQVGQFGGWPDVGAPDGPDTQPVQAVRQQARFLRTSGLMDVWEKLVTFTAGTLLNWSVPFVVLILLALFFLKQQGVSADGALPLIGTALAALVVVLVLSLLLQKAKKKLPDWAVRRPDHLALVLSLLTAALLWLAKDWTGLAVGVAGSGLAWFFGGAVGLVADYPRTVVAVLALGVLFYYGGLASKKKAARLWRRVFVLISMLVAVLCVLALVRAGLDAVFVKPGSGGVSRWISFRGFWQEVQQWPRLVWLTTGGVSIGVIVAGGMSLKPLLPFLDKPQVQKVLKALGLIAAGLLLPVLAVVTFMGLMLLGHFENVFFSGWRGADVLWLAAILIGLAEVFVLDVNLTGPQRLYRAGLSRTFVELGNQGQDFPLSEMNPKNTAPVHLLHGALNLPNCDKPQLRERQCDFFLFSKHFCGSPALGYTPAASWLLNGRPLDLATAMAISGAAFSANMGQGSIPAVRALLAFLNVRLGCWLRRPDLPGKFGLPIWPHPGFVCLLREMFAFGMKGDKEAWVNVSDGGHIENLATYELLRRRCKFVICVDGECDPNFGFHGLMTLARHARLDLGVRIEPDVSELRPNPETGLSRSHFHLCRIHYPAAVGHETGTGLLLYLKLSVTGNEPAFIQAYRRNEPIFPHQTTMDQFFDETQFEAYRQLGVHVARGLFAPRLMDSPPPHQPSGSGSSALQGICCCRELH